VADRIRAAAPDGRVDTYGGDYVKIALCVAPERVDTVVRFDAAEKCGVKLDGNASGASIATPSN
jgi:hypothetical protein